MYKSISLLLFCCCILCHVTVSGEVGEKKTMQRDSVEVHWYNARNLLFELHTAAQLRGFAKLVNTGIDFHGQTVKLSADIQLNDTTGWQKWDSDSYSLNQWIPIGQEDKPFCGTFDGQDHSLYGLYINRGTESYYQGLFGLVLDGRIRNVHVKATYIKGHDHIGGIAGMIGYTSEVQGCTFEGKIVGMGHMVGGIVGKAEEYNRIVDCANMGDVHGQRRVGGIAGSFAFGEVYNCFNRGNIKGRHEEVGGLIGSLFGGRFGNWDGEWAKGVVRMVEKRRQVTAKELRYSFANNYNTGAITGEDKVGGIIGAFFSFEDRDTIDIRNDSLNNVQYRESIANSVRAWTKKNMYFANCYNAGRISSHYPVYTDGLIGHYDWNWQSGVYLLDQRGGRCFWSDSSVVVVKVETWRLPRAMRSFDELQEIYLIRPPKVFQEVADNMMRSAAFADQLNEWTNEQGRPFHHWRSDSEQINQGYPVFEPEGAQP